MFDDIICTSKSREEIFISEKHSVQEGDWIYLYYCFAFLFNFFFTLYIPYKETQIMIDYDLCVWYLLFKMSFGLLLGSLAGAWIDQVTYFLKVATGFQSR